MQFHETRQLDRPIRLTPARRVWDGIVKGAPDCWVVVAREEQDLADWFESEELAIGAAPLRICRAILDDDVLVLTGNDSCGPLPFEDPA